MLFDSKTYERLLSIFIASQGKKIEELLDAAIQRVSSAVSRFFGGKAQNKDFYFKDYPSLQRLADEEIRHLTSDMTTEISSGIEWSWDLANTKNDDMLASIIDALGAETVSEKVLDRWRQKNLSALQSFLKRKENGLYFSDKVWNYNRGIKEDMETAISISLGEGASADRLSQSVRKYLRNPNKLFRRVWDKDKGEYRLSKAASEYHPGQGVYRSSYMNAKRLAASENNLAYKTADYERRKNMGFILGIEVHLSNNHTCLGADGKPHEFYDICDILQGRYPKDFKFVPWHPWCRCYTTTILPSQDEFFLYLDEMDEYGNSTYVSKNEVKDVPEAFKNWCRENQYRIKEAERNGTLPYFIRDNEERVSAILRGAGEYYAPVTDSDWNYLISQGLIRREDIGLYKRGSDKDTQSAISKFATSKATNDSFFEYAQKYSEQSEEAESLLRQINDLKGKDEITRLRKINRLRNLCGDMTASELEKAGVVGGLKYTGVISNYHVIDGLRKVVRGRTIVIDPVVRDLVEFKSKKNKVAIYFPIGASVERAKEIEPQRVSGVIAKAPAYLKKYLSKVVIMDVNNPQDEYWKVEYNNPLFVSGLTAGGIVTYWAPQKSVEEDLLHHEAAHNFDKAHGVTSSTNEWLQAMTKDIQAHLLDGESEQFPSPYAAMAFKSSRGTNVVEDFAESIRFYIKNTASFKKRFPERSSLIEKIIKKFPLG